MKNENSYQMIIYFIIFIFIKSIIDLMYEIKNPDSSKINKNDKLATTLENVENIFSYITIFFILVLFIFYKLNNLIFFLLVIILTSTLEYFLVNKRYIYLFIKPSNFSDKIVNFLDLYFDKLRIFMLMSFSLFCLSKILI
jgi:hypothetical protein